MEKTIVSAFSRRRITRPPTWLSEKHSDFGDLDEFRSLSWEDPAGVNFEVAARVLHLFTRDTFLFVFAKYMVFSLRGIKRALGNEYTSMLFLFMSLRANSEITDGYVSHFASTTKEEWAAISQWIQKMNESEFGNHVVGFRSFEEQCASHFAPQV